MKPRLHDDQTTIFAVASPPGRGMRGIVRLSGPDAWSCVEPLLVAGEPVRPRYFEERKLRLPLLEAKVPVSLAWLPGPRSYTREDMVEVHTFGSPVLLSTICDALLANGAELAEPGEFTRRSFLNGRIDLTRAEAVLNVIHSQNEIEHRLATEQLRGTLHERIRQRKEKLLYVCAFCEAAIDFSDQDIEVIDENWVEREIVEALEDVQNLLEEARSARPAAEGLRTLLVGRPNVGKSSLLNCLAGRGAAVVSRHPGTTRDVVDTAISIDGLRFRMRDTAGVRQAQDELEEEGIRRTRIALESADLVLFVMDGSEPLKEEDLRLAAHLEVPGTLLVLNKVDLPLKAALDDLPESIRRLPAVKVSALTGEGREELFHCMTSAVENGISSGQSFLINTRQRGCLMSCAESLRAAQETVSSGEGLEFIAVDLREALNHFGELVGEVVTDDILGVIFSQFCIGK